MSAQEEEVENIEDMEQYQLELVETCERSLEEILDDFDKVVNMPNSNQSKKEEMNKFETRLLALKEDLEFFKSSSGLDKATKEKLNTIYESVKLQINELKKHMYPGAQSYFLPNTLNRGFSVKTPEPVLPKSQGSADAFNIFSPRAQAPRAQAQRSANSFNIFSPRAQAPRAQAPRAQGFNGLSPLGNAQFAQPQGYGNSSNVFSPLAQAPKANLFSPRAQKSHGPVHLNVKAAPNTFKRQGGSKKTQRKRTNNKRKSRKSRG